MDVLLLVAEGLSNAEIGDRLYLSPRTVEKHVASLLGRTGARTRAQLATLFARHLRAGPREWPALPPPSAASRR